MTDEGGTGASDAVCVSCCDGGGADEEVVGREEVVGGLVERLSSPVAVSWPSSLSELGVDEDASTLLASAVYVIDGVRSGTPGNVFMATFCGARFASTG